jgi:hypothetical protein
MLLQKQKGANATVTICHTGTKDIAYHTRRADILIVAAGALYFMVSCSYAARLCLGWKLVWYQILAVSTGMFSWGGYLIYQLYPVLYPEELIWQYFPDS